MAIKYTSTYLHVALHCRSHLCNAENSPTVGCNTSAIYAVPGMACATCMIGTTGEAAGTVVLPRKKHDAIFCGAHCLYSEDPKIPTKEGANKKGSLNN